MKNILERLDITPSPWSKSAIHNILRNAYKHGPDISELHDDGENVPRYTKFTGISLDSQLISKSPGLLLDEIKNTKDAEKIITCLDEGDIESIRYFALRILARSIVGQEAAIGKTWQEIKQLLEQEQCQTGK